MGLFGLFLFYGWLRACVLGVVCVCRWLSFCVGVSVYFGLFCFLFGFGVGGTCGVVVLCAD